jgi:cellulose 1,4-beta-cellobiosidase
MNREPPDRFVDHYAHMVARLTGPGWLWFLAATLVPAVACEPSSENVPPQAAVATQGAPAATPSNPFAGAQFYVDPAFAAEVESAATQMPDRGARLRSAGRFPTAVWLNSIATAQTAGRKLDEAVQQQRASGQPVLTVFVLYNLPNRDCAAASSSGELSVEQDGEARYQKEFIDVAAAAFRAHPSQRIVAILEPDSLANVVTNLAKPKCAASEAVYRRAIAYAVRALSIPNVSVYLDAAHAGWLGWNDNRRGAARIFADVLARAGSGARLRGFSINVSNYDPLVVTGEGRAGSGNPCPDELTYARKLAESLAEVGLHDVSFVVDTSRNGRTDLRARPESWCNVRGAGIGERPRAAPAAGIDAYYWIKPPGESDGTSDPAAPRYDASCSTPDSAPSAPQAGVFFPSYFAELVANANPPL